MEWCLIKPHTYRMFFAITGSDYMILMSSETNESAAHTWPLLALSCITVITHHKADFSISLHWDPSPFTYFHPDTMHIFSLYLFFSHPPSLSPVLSFPQGYIHTSSSFIANLPLFPVTSSAVGDVRDPVSKAPSLLSDRPQSQSLPLSGAEVYTHGKLIPMPCLPHIVLMSKVVRWLETGVTFWKRQTHCGKPLH